MDTLGKLVRFVQRPRDTNEHLYHLFLTQQTQFQNLYPGYLLLAALLHAGYFSVVLTTNDDTLLEMALQEQGILPSDYQIVSIGREPDEKVARALDGLESGIRVVKFCVDKNVPVADEIQDSLQGYLQQNIIVVGCINAEHHDIVQALAGTKDKSMYYIVPERPCSDIELDILQKRHKQYKNFLINGHDGEFVNFFSKLAVRLLSPHFRVSKPDTIARNTYPGTSDGKVPGLSAESKRSEKNQPNPPNNTRPLEAIIQAEETSQPGDEPELQVSSQTKPLEAIIQVEETVGSLLSGDGLEIQRGSGPLEDWRDNSGPLEELRNNSGPLEIGSLPYIQANEIRQFPWPGGVDVLLVTVANVELKAFLSRYPQKVRRTANGKTYYDLGLVGQARTVVVQANNMGPIIAHATVDEGIRALSPRAVIMVGIAFGVRTKGQQIGDILVSKQIHDYDLERVGTGEDNQPLSYPRGAVVAASDWLIDRFYASSYEWLSPPEIHFGVILSGSKLVDNKEYHNALVRSAPDAIGGEMEGGGLAIAASHRKVDWLLVKGISDWGDGTKGVNKREHQRLAAENAARFVLFVIEQEDFLH